MIKNKLFFTSFFFALIFSACFTPEAFSLSMKEAVKSALENNHRIKQYTHLEQAARENISIKKSLLLPSANLSYSVDLGNTNEEASVEDSSEAAASIIYNLFNGFSDQANLKGAEANALAQTHRKKAVQADVILETKLAYIGVLRANRAWLTAKESVELLERQVRDARLFLKEGLFAKNDVLKVEVELSTARQEFLQAEGDLNVAKKKLESAMGKTLKQGEPIEDFDNLPQMENMSFDALSPKVLENRSELKYLKALETVYGYKTDAIKGEYLPRVDVSVSYIRYGDSFLATGRDAPLSDSETIAEITATWNIFDGYNKKHRINETLAQIEAVKEEIKDSETALLLQLSEAMEGYAVASARLETAKASVSQAEENYRVTDNQFRQQVATTTDLLDARFYLTRAKNQYNNALYDIHSWAERIERIVEEK